MLKKPKAKSNSRVQTHFGHVAIAGRPNAGKSTLLNAMLGSKLAIVSAKPQTTRSSIMGVATEDEGQIVFFDTPGIHRGDTLINRRMMQSVRASLEGKDLLLYVVDVTALPPSGEIPEEEKQALDTLRKAREAGIEEDGVADADRKKVPAFLILNKVDRVEDKRHLLPILEAFSQLMPFDELFPISASKGEGIAALKKAILARLPLGKPRFEADYFTDMPERNIAAEVIREKILRLTGEEVPHSVAVLVEKWEEKPNVVVVSASIVVERPGQKPILVGAGGTMIKRIGTDARKELEEMLGRKFFLELFVKVKPKWRENESFLNELGWQNTSEVK
ncbi:GTPase Era [Bryobacter aggregatus]|uniref:GTPase Era n=1 Tax=Bryobacter aggregatus TaxID=360054 RepID=UPI00068930E9|nr:GTPase Era [Bryobacter aggregatus]